MSSTAAVELEGVSKRYGNLTAVGDVSFSVDKGELVTLLGPSGCGKSTILRTIAGFVRPTSGSVRIAGSDVNHLPPHRRCVGIVFQNYALFPHLTVGENVAFGLKMRGFARDVTRSRVVEMLTRVRLAEKIGAYPRQLSGGQQQRVALARALIIEPDILLLDEPFGALDRELRQHMQGEMRRLQRSYGISTLLVTHDQEEALILSDRIAVLNGGAIQQTGTAADVFEHPRTRFVAEFMGRANLLVGRIRDDAAVSGARLALCGSGIEIPLPVVSEQHGGDVTVLVRPERIKIEAATAGVPSTNLPADNAFAGKIVELNYLGATVEVRIAIGESADAVLVARVPAPVNGSRPFAFGDLIRVTLPHDAIHVMAPSDAHAGARQ